MGYHWKALILTESNILQNVEFECPSNWRKDAEAMAKSMYGAKEVRFCNPISKSSSSDNSSNSFFSSSGGDASFGGLLILGAFILVYVFRYVILFALIAGAIYYIIKWIKK